MGTYEELPRRRREFLDDYLTNTEKPAYKCYQDAFGCAKSTAQSQSSELLNDPKIMQATAQLLGPQKTAIVVKMSKLGDRAVKELKDLITLKPVSKVEVGEGEKLLDNRRLKLKAIKTLLNRIGIEGSGDDINIAINNAPDQKTVNVNLDELDEEQREDFLKTSREVYIE